MWERLGEAVSNKSLTEYLTWICERFAVLQEQDLEKTSKLFEEAQDKLYLFRSDIINYQSQVLNLEGCGKVWKEWEVLRVKVDRYLRELGELECEAILGPENFGYQCLKPSVEENGDAEVGEEIALVVKKVLQIDTPQDGTTSQASPLFTPRRTSFGSIDPEDSTAQQTPMVAMSSPRGLALSLLPFGIGIRSPTGVPTEPSPSNSTADLLRKATIATERLRDVSRPLGDGLNAARARENNKATSDEDMEEDEGAEETQPAAIQDDEPMDEDEEEEEVHPGFLESSEDERGRTLVPVRRLPSPTPTMAILPHFGPPPLHAVICMTTMKIKDIPGRNRNCKMGRVGLIREPENYKKFKFAWLLKYTLYYSDFYNRWLRLPPGWVPDWPDDMDWPEDDEEHIRQYFEACCSRLAHIHPHYRTTNLRELSISPPPPLAREDRKRKDVEEERGLEEGWKKKFLEEEITGRGLEEGWKKEFLEGEHLSHIGKGAS
ncbi:hypothetical protein DFP72DRAFT_1128840 [Ephemerocybe angulata]|uniref:Uncharacterized protein n=1 Tax=Ephemerocybe angulata TaxID=980116 RepID=A0A8H6HUM1_9AGAR|nr:hypothetical protein DFP72DRAFT_1128840 [Tulosesus angulatus]